jgi:hypothetical protein
VATLNAVIATVGVGALAIHLGSSGVALVVLCLGIFLSYWVFLSYWAGLFALQLRAFRTARQSVARFPVEEE